MTKLLCIHFPEIDFATLEVNGDSFVWYTDAGIEQVSFDTPEEAATNAVNIAKQHYDEEKKYNMCWGGPGRCVVDVAFGLVTGFIECRVAICEIVGYSDLWADVYNRVMHSYCRHRDDWYRLNIDYESFKKDNSLYQQARQEHLDKYGSQEFPLEGPSGSTLLRSYYYKKYL